MQENTSRMLYRAGHFQAALIGEGLAVGIVSGFVVLSYRVALEYAGKWLSAILARVSGAPLLAVLWLGALALLAFLVSRLLAWEPLISGSGIPQLEGEMTGRLDPCWWKVLPAKFAGGFLCLLGGLSLGREGPSIQLGAMAGKGFSRLTGKGITEERFLLTCGASAGLAAAFHAPLAGAQGGIFFPMLVLGSLIGGIFGLAGVEWFGMDPSNVNNFVLLSMAGFFTAVVRAPLTGILLIFEMTGSVSQLLSLSIISIVAYIVANFLSAAPIYESLLEGLLRRRGEETHPQGGERVLMEISIHQESSLAGRRIAEVCWPKDCLVVAVARNSRELIPRGNTVLLSGDLLIVMTDAAGQSQVYDRIKALCTGP